MEGGRSDQWSPICTTAGDASARATVALDVADRCSDRQRAGDDWVRSNRVNVPDFSVTRSVSSQSIHSSKPTSRSTTVDSPARHTRGDRPPLAEPRSIASGARREERVELGGTPAERFGPLAPLGLEDGEVGQQLLARAGLQRGGLARAAASTAR
jgi:hypothetical protein